MRHWLASTHLKHSGAVSVALMAYGQRVLMKKLLITGSSGFLGAKVVEEFKKHSPALDAIHTFRSSQYDLRDAAAIRQLLNDKPSDTIVHLAAVVGGIGANMKSPGTFMYDNLM